MHFFSIENLKCTGPNPPINIDRSLNNIFSLKTPMIYSSKYIWFNHRFEFNSKKQTWLLRVKLFLQNTIYALTTSMPTNILVIFVFSFSNYRDLSIFVKWKVINSKQRKSLLIQMLLPK